MSTTSKVTRDGLEGVRPDRQAAVSASAGTRPRRGAGGEGLVERPDFQSYYGLPVLNKPTWEPLDIAGYLFLGGLAGSSSVLAAAGSLTGRQVLSRRLRVGAAGAISLSLAALVHDLGRPSRFYNMLRVFKPSSPMSVGSWILSAYGPAAIGAAALPWLPLPGPARAVARRLAGPSGAVAAALGPAVATYTAVLVADTSVPAWHGGYREMPFLFAGSASSAGGGLGMMVTATSAAAMSEAAPARRLAATGGVVELVAGRIMRRRMGLAAECFEQGRAGRLMKAAEATTAAGTVLALAGRGRRAVSALGGALLVAGSALTRFGIFAAGVQSAEDPKYTVQPQRERLDRSS